MQQGNWIGACMHLCQWAYQIMNSVYSPWIDTALIEVPMWLLKFGHGSVCLVDMLQKQTLPQIGRMAKTEIFEAVILHPRTGVWPFGGLH